MPRREEMRCAFAAVSLALVIVAGTVAAGEAKHDPAFWQSIAANRYQVPEGQSADALIVELNAFLGSPDPKLRDDYAYSIGSTWIRRDKRIAPRTLRALLHQWTANLNTGIGSTGSDAVFLRSFSALSLSTLAALDNDTPWLTGEEHADLLGAALRYLEAEKDLRGFDPKTGWMHATAHTADLLKFLGRSPRLRVADQARILQAIDAKLGAVPDVFTHGENERLAAAVHALASRDDLDAVAFAAFVSGIAERGRPLWANGPMVDPRQYAVVQNGKDLLRTLYVGLIASDTKGSRTAVRGEILKALATLE